VYIHAVRVLHSRLRGAQIFKDEVLEQQLESLVGTMKAAKKRGLIAFEGQMLLQGAHDHVVVTIV
jgi:hypothetical protein